MYKQVKEFRIMNEVKFICENCNKEFYARPQDKRGKHIFCSMGCQHQWRTGKTNLVNWKGKYKICPVCSNEFYCYPYEIDKKKTCSRECKGEYERSLGIHQGEKCNFWTGGFDSYRGENWYSQREKARERDNNTCKICGKTYDEQGYNMIVHHKVPFRFFKNNYQKANDLENLVCVCHNCHATQESHQWSEVPSEYQFLLKGLKPQVKPPAGKRYSKEEVDFIEENYNKFSYDDLAKIMNRPKLSIADKVLELGLNKREGYIGRFNKQEKDLMIKYYPILNKDELMKLFPNRTYRSITSFARRNKIKKLKTIPSEAK